MAEGSGDYMNAHTFIQSLFYYFCHRYIEFNELRAFAKQVTPKQNLEDAEDLLRYLDQDKDSKVSFIVSGTPKCI